MSKPPSRKHYERTKPTYKELEDRLEVARLNALSASTYEKELKSLVKDLRLVADWFDVYPGGDENASSNFGQIYRVMRGGSWLDSDSQLRAAGRNWISKTFFMNGFRCSRSAATP